MDDKQNNNNNPHQNGNNNTTDLTLKAKEERAEFGSAGHDDINKNLGSFGNDVAKQQAPEIKLDVDAKIVEKAAQEKIDFERFAKNKRTEKAAKTRFGEKVSIMLRSKKGLRTTWILEMVLMVAIIAMTATFIGIMTKYKGATGDGPVPLPEVQKPLSVGLVFAWISLFPCIIPLVYLVTSWFVGINQVASSRLYHFLFWICGLISLICFVVALGCLIGPMHQVNVYPPF